MAFAIIFKFSNQEKIKKIKVPKNISIQSENPEIEVAPVAQETDYQAGFRDGFYAFIEQSGQYVAGFSSNSNRPVYKYTSSSNDEDQEETSNSSDQRIQGYIDGYHKAADSMSCPRSGYSH